MIIVRTADALIAIVFGLVAYSTVVDPTASPTAVIGTAARLFERVGL